MPDMSLKSASGKFVNFATRQIRVVSVLLHFATSECRTLNVYRLNVIAVLQ
jgi:hypothetical protein